MVVPTIREKLYVSADSDGTWLVGVEFYTALDVRNRVDCSGSGVSFICQAKACLIYSHLVSFVKSVAMDLYANNFKVHIIVVAK